jgi:formamidopyrimidine-DNA glycosylase
MPEGHTIHRLARLHRGDLAGRRVAVDSPQGRFAGGAARLDGTVLAGVDAYGKHLFYRWEDGGGDHLTLHVHLGLFGRFRTFHGDAPLPTDSTRLRMRAEKVTVHLAGAVAVELLDPPEEDLLRARLGPDPLARRTDPEPAWAALQRRRTPIGAALLDQKVLAGIGNVFRAESLFACGIHPSVPANTLARAEFDQLWATLRRMLRAGERSGRIVTVDPAEVGARSAARVPPDERVHVYRRTGLPCRRCATAIESWTCAGRTISACPTCQPRPVRRAARAR